MRKVRIEDNKVVEILVAEPFPPFHPSLIWVECEDENVREGFIYENGIFKEEDTSTYVEKRVSEYPQIGELADALYWNSKGDPSHLEEYFNKCEAVKNKYPKEIVND